MDFFSLSLSLYHSDRIDEHKILRNHLIIVELKDKKCTFCTFFSRIDPFLPFKKPDFNNIRATMERRFHNQPRPKIVTRPHSESCTGNRAVIARFESWPTISRKRHVNLEKTMNFDSTRCSIHGFEDNDRWFLLILTMDRKVFRDTLFPDNAFFLPLLAFFGWRMHRFHFFSPIFLFSAKLLYSCLLFFHFK